MCSDPSPPSGCAITKLTIITLLTTLQETQERTRKRIKEDLKESNNAYAEYADSTLPKLKSRYLKKFAEAEVSLSPSPQCSLSLPPHRN